MRSKHNIFLLMCLYGLLITGCTLSKTYPVMTTNPTEYVFNVEIDYVKKVIKYNFNKEQFYGLTLESVEEPLLADRYFKDTNNINDFVLEEFLNFGVCRSKVYYDKRDYPHVYYAKYYIHLEAIGDTQTRVRINVLKSGVVYKAALFTLPHFNRGSLLMELPPTTVEEYEILLIIGKTLEMKDMPKMKIPKKIIINKRSKDY